MEQKVKIQLPNSQDFSFDEHLPLAPGGSDSRCSAGRSEQQLRGFVQGFGQLQGKIRVWEDQEVTLARTHGGAVLPAGIPGSSPLSGSASLVPARPFRERPFPPPPGRQGSLLSLLLFLTAKTPPSLCPVPAPGLLQRRNRPGQRQKCSFARVWHSQERGLGK